MKNLRAGFRLAGFVFLTVVVVLFFCIGLPFCGFFPQGRIRWKTVLMSRWARIMSAIIGLRINFIGKLPEPPFFLVSNHLSYLDILPFWGYLRTTFVAKSEIKNWPFIGFAARLFGIIFLDRNRSRDLSRVNALIAKSIDKYQGTIVFPEGTSSKGEKVLPFNSSLLYYPSSKKIPVHYASISYQILENGSHNAWQDVCWWGDMEFLSHFWNVLKIKSTIVSVHFGDDPIQNGDRKLLTEQLQQAVEQHFSPTFTEN